MKLSEAAEIDDNQLVVESTKGRLAPTIERTVEWKMLLH